MFFTAEDTRNRKCSQCKRRARDGRGMLVGVARGWRRLVLSGVQCLNLLQRDASYLAACSWRFVFACVTRRSIRNV